MLISAMMRSYVKEMVVRCGGDERDVIYGV